MLQSYVTIALRNVHRNKGYSFINLFGLAVSLAACLILGLYVAQSLSYDRFHADADRIVRVVQYDPDVEGHATMPPGLAGAIEENFPEVETVTENRGFAGPEQVLTRGDTYFEVDRVITVDEHFFDVFSFPLIRGDVEAALATPNQLILTVATARRIFGDADPIGQTLRLNGTVDYTVTALAADPPPNTHLPFNMIQSPSERDRQLRTDEVKWNFFQSRIYVKLKPGVDRAAFAEKLNAFQAEHRTAEQGQPAALSLQPLTHIYLHSKLNGEYALTSDVRYLYIFGAAGLLILLIACVNYVNLATARGMQRAKEIGVRKVIGARRAQLVHQFLGESILLVLLALPIALVLATLALPVMNELTGQALSLRTANRPIVWLGAFGLILMVGSGAGAYPAFALSAFHPLRVLKGGGPAGRGRHWLRRGLIVFQFAASIALIAGALVVYAQLDYLQTKRLGFDTAQVVTFHAPNWKWERFDAFKASLRSEPSITGVASGPPLGINWRTATLRPPVTADSDERWDLDLLTVGYDYVETAGLELLAGRSFSREFPSDPEEAVLITASAVERLGFDDDGLGEMVDLFEEMTVVGVVEDFHNVSLKEPLKPTAILLDPTQTGHVLVRLATGRTEAGLAALERAWTALVPERPFVFEFLDEQIQAQYLAEERLSRVFGLFAGLAVALASLGLFGLAAFAAQQRTKEIGIRKVLGANVVGLVALLSKDFLRLVAIAFVLGAPLAYFAMQRWLDDFAYRIQIGPGLFLLLGTLALGVAAAAVSYQSIRAALAEPVESLRYE